MRHEFLLTFKFAAILFLRIPHPNNTRRIYAKDKDTEGKIPKNGLKNDFWVPYRARNEDPSNDPRAYVLAEVGAVIRKTVRENNKKRDSDTERANNSPKRHANCGPSSPVSIPTPGDSLAQVSLAQWHI